MPSWLRLWHDMPNDPKWRTISHISNQSIALVQAAYLHLLVDASRNVTLGHIEVTIEDLASALDVTEESIAAIIDAMQGRVLDGNVVSGWEKRQPSREDAVGIEKGAKTAVERKRAQRERERSQGKEVIDNAMSRNVTQCHAPETETETEKETENKTHLRKLPKSKQINKQSDEAFAAFWKAFPKKRNKGDAYKAWVQLSPDADLIATIMNSIESGKASNHWREDGGKYIKYPASWLRAECWEDQYDEARYGSDQISVMQIYNNTLVPTGWPEASEQPYSQERDSAITDFKGFSNKPGFIAKYFGIVSETLKPFPGCGFDWVIKRETFLKIKEDVYGVAA